MRPVVLLPFRPWDRNNLVRDLCLLPLLAVEAVAGITGTVVVGDAAAAVLPGEAPVAAVLSEAAVEHAVEVAVRAEAMVVDDVG